jgi:hypothetical protein
MFDERGAGRNKDGKEIVSACLSADIDLLCSVPSRSPDVFLSIDGQWGPKPSF